MLVCAASSWSLSPLSGAVPAKYAPPGHAMLLDGLPVGASILQMRACQVSMQRGPGTADGQRQRKRKRQSVLPS